MRNPPLNIAMSTPRRRRRPRLNWWVVGGIGFIIAAWVPAILAARAALIILGAL